MSTVQDLANSLEGVWVVKPIDNYCPIVLDGLNVKGSPVHFVGSQLKFDRIIDKVSKTGLDFSFCVVDDNVLVHQCEFPVLKVNSVDKARERLAIHRRSSFPGSVVAITGSVGKTTTKNILNDVLKESHNLFVGARSFNTKKMIVNQVLALENEDVAVFEMSRTASLPGSRITKPNVAVLTAITESHLGAVSSTEEIVKLKSRIFRGLSENGVAIINRQIPHFNMAFKIAKKYTDNVITYGDRKGDFKLLSYVQSRGLVKVDLKGVKLSFKLSLEGRHNAINSLAVLAVIHALGFKVEDYLGLFNKIAPVDGRGAKSSIYLGARKLNLINDAFNANPLSMNASLSSFANSKVSGRKILCLGDMLELGELSSQLHAQLLNSVVSVNPDKVYLVGECMSSLWAILPNEIKGGHFMKLEHLSNALYCDSLDGDTVLFKSSNGTGLYKVFEEFRDEYSVKSENLESVRVVAKGDGLGKSYFLRWMKKRCAEIGLNGWIRIYDDDAVEFAVSGFKADVHNALSIIFNSPDGSLVSSYDVLKYNKRLKSGFRVFKKRSS